MSILRWGLALALGGFLVFFGFLKFSGEAHIFPYIEYKSTALGVPLAGLFFPLVHWATGALEILSGALLIIPATRRLGAQIAVLPFLGAVAFHLSPLLGISTPTGYAVPKPVDALANGGPFIASDFATEMTTGLFTIALAGLIVAIINAIVQRSA